MLVLQVPNPGADDSETYVVRLDRPEHRTWMEKLPESRRLLDLLTMEMHVVYSPADGGMTGVPDIDRPGPFKQTFDTARGQAEQGVAWERYFAQRGRRSYPQSRMRRQLLGQRQAGRRR